MRLVAALLVLALAACGTPEEWAQAGADMGKAGRETAQRARTNNPSR